MRSRYCSRQASSCRTAPSTRSVPRLAWLRTFAPQGAVPRRPPSARGRRAASACSSPWTFGQTARTAPLQAVAATASVWPRAAGALERHCCS
eukprot:CAMPEP_0179041842 /NCGR_PEP_ID=MMETSP0796-20121207/16362_1 /TAXON_ID=73915 /ORGANISM="Pyrodinium bahamense, Strain pbaha01" /LENGTH=91 /DNA_ID=CAMNT_0020738213 /DNA_START=71 /DNA_END=346 /DNA_ORIENTATION=+